MKISDLELSILSEIIYETDITTRIKLYHRLDFFLKRAFDKSNEQADVLTLYNPEYDQRTIVVNIRGTQMDGDALLESFSDWRANLAFLRWYDWRTGWAHGGALWGMKALWDQAKMGKFIHELIDANTSEVIFTGHSRGAGLADLGAAMLAEELTDLWDMTAGASGLEAFPSGFIKSINFATPRFGMKGLTKRFDKYRIECRNYCHHRKNNRGNSDPVTKVMPRGKFFYPYRHPNRVKLQTPDNLSSVESHRIKDYQNSVQAYKGDQEWYEHLQNVQAQLQS